MAKIAKFPTLAERDSPSHCYNAKRQKTQVEILSTLMQLAWEDIEAFLSLEANCLSRKPVQFNQRVLKKLKKLELINDGGYTPINISTLIQSIMLDYQYQNNKAL